MGKKLSPVIDKLRAWRTARLLSQSQAVRALSKAGLPIKLSTLQGWEIGRSAPYPVTAAALERFLAEQERKSLTQRTLSDVVVRLKNWREANHLNRVQAVELLNKAGIPVKYRTMYQWETGQRHPSYSTSWLLDTFLSRIQRALEQGTVEEEITRLNELFGPLDINKVIQLLNEQPQSSETLKEEHAIIERLEKERLKNQAQIARKFPRE